MTVAYPLQWPEGWPRTSPERRERSRFKVTPDRAMRNLLEQLRILGARNVVVSSNVAIRQDGRPYADQARRIIRDPGVAVYFTLNGKQMSMARDLYETPHENIHALGHAIEHIRGIERHGGGFMMQRAFSGFSALPPPADAEPLNCWDELNLNVGATAEQINARWRELMAKHHPDKPGGSHDKASRINRARDLALAWLKEKAA